MISTLLLINMMMSLAFIMITHPLSMGMILLIQTILISLITGNLNFNFWYSYILFLILIGGMLVLFMYMTSIASNEKFNMNVKLLLIMMVIPMSMLTKETNYQMSLVNNETLMMNINNSVPMSLSKFINFPMNMVMIFLIIYLLLTLIATVKITNFKKGPIRQMN